MQRDSKQMELHGGFQAHLPTFVSPMVLEMVTKFPDEIALNEVPRLSTWPVQFHDHGTKEDHIALYFFARDLERYASKYSQILSAVYMVFLFCFLHMKFCCGTAMKGATGFCWRI